MFNLKKKYIIFIVQHMGSLFQFITLKETLYKKEKVILFVNKPKFTDTKFAKNLIKENIFENIISYSEPLTKFDSEDINSIIKIFDKVFEDNSVNINDIKHTVSACDTQNLFAIYLATKKINVDYIELIPNQLCDNNRYAINRICAGAPLWVEELSIKYDALTGAGKNTKKRYLYPESKIEFKKDIHYDFVKEFYNLPREYKDKILKCLEINDKIDFNNFNVLLCNSSGWSCPKTGLQLPYHYIPYLLIADYYFLEKDNVYIKDHPQTPRQHFDKNIATHSQTLNAETPIEFFGLLENFHIKKLVSVKSSGNDKIKRFVDEEIKIGDSFLFNFRRLHKTYISYMIQDYLDRKSNLHIFNLSKEFALNLKNIACNKVTENDIRGINPSILKGNIFTLISDYTMEQGPKLEIALLGADIDTKVVFYKLNDYLPFSIDSINLLDYLVPITIKKEKLREDTLSDIESETIYFFCKSEEIRNKLKIFTFSKDLKNTGIKVNVLINEDKSLIDNIKFKILTQEIKKQNETITLLTNEIHSLKQKQGEN